MDIDDIRAFCLALPQTREQLQWGDSLLLKVADKMFVILNLSVESPHRLAFKCAPEKYAELVEREGITPSRYNMWKYHWVSLARLDTLGNAELKELMRASYELIAAKAIKKEKTGHSRSSTTPGKAARRGSKKPAASRKRRSQ
jgi:predicted DNA-binding protein (MmcQ/YjbR family)